MRLNEPVTQNEYQFDPNSTLMSTTDTESHIQYANSAFVNVSGFAADELINQPHNIVRHPDMPPEAFADMWETLSSGRSWTALVKNRRKDGDHYWVRANATPVNRDGRISGYMSVRTRPAASEISQAEKLYRDFRNGASRHLKFYHGIIIRKGPLGFLSLMKTITLRWRVRLTFLGIFILCTLLLGIYTTSSLTLWYLPVLAVICLAADIWLEFQVCRPLQLIREQAQAVASGNPGRNIQLDRADDIGFILRSVNQSGLNLRALIEDVSVQVDGLNHTIHDIARGSTDLSTRTQQSAASLEETAAAMEELNATIKNNTQSAEQAVNLAKDASSAAEAGSKSVDTVISKMASINDRSEKISNIITVMDNIAFKTNILALNASVEAARAGEHGRGFAVVAGEVRNLAQHSSESASEIRALITSSVDETRSGHAQVSEAGEHMKSILTLINKVNSLIDEITQANREQSNGVDQVCEAISQLDQVTQNNSTLVSQSENAATELRQRAERLTEALRVYQTSRETSEGHQPFVADSA